MHVISLFVRPGSAVSAGWLLLHGSYGGRGLHAWLRPGRHLDLYIVFWTALHVVGVSLFCEAGERCVSGLAFGTRQLWWPWVACLAAAWEAFECVHYIIIDFVSSMYGHWYWRAVVRGPSFWISRAGESGGVVHVAWSWAAGRPEWRVNAGCVDVYIRELDAPGA